MDTPRWETHNQQSGFDPYTINPVSGTPGVVTFAGINGTSEYANGFDKNNFAPRVGFAYQATAKTVIRAGYGIGYNGLYTGSVSSIFTGGFGLNASFSSPDGGFTPAFQFSNAMPVIPTQPLTPAFGAVRVGDPSIFSPAFVQQNQVNGYAEQWNFTVQRELNANFMIELSYLGNEGHHLGGPVVNINQIPLVNGRGPAVQTRQALPYPQFGNVNLYSAPWGNSNYNSLNVKLERRYANGLNLLANYTWSKYIDDVPGVADLGGASYEHIQLHRLDKSLSGNDIPHRFVASVVYDLPFGRTQRFRISNPLAQALFGGWGTGVIGEFRSGSPYGVVEQTNHSNTNSTNQRPNLVRDPVLSSDRSRAAMLAQYFDTSAFQDPGVGVFGNAPRNVAHGPGFSSLDVSVHKRWSL